MAKLRKALEDALRKRKAKAERRRLILDNRRNVKQARKVERHHRNVVEASAAEIEEKLERDVVARRQLERDDRLPADDPNKLRPAARDRLEAELVDEARRQELERRVEQLLNEATSSGARLEDLHRRRRELAHELEAVEGRLRKLTRRATRLRRKIKRRRHRRNLDRTVAFDGAPVSQGIALMLAACRAHGWAGVVTSGDRREGVAEKFGKMSQAALFRCYQAFLSTGHCSCSSCNPANPPGRSTHELRDDGIYGGPVGRKLAAWQLGIDATDADRLRAIAQELGFDLRRPYSSPSEQHHSNLFANPKPTLEKLGKI